MSALATRIAKLRYTCKAKAVSMTRQILRGRVSGSWGLSRETSVEGRKSARPTQAGPISRSSAFRAPIPVKQFTRDEWSYKIASIIDEYLDNKDIKVEHKLSPIFVLLSLMK